MHSAKKTTAPLYQYVPEKNKPEPMISELLYGERFIIEEHINKDWVKGVSERDDYEGIVNLADLEPAIPAGYRVAHITALRSFIRTSTDVKIAPKLPLSLGSRIVLDTNAPLDKGFQMLITDGEYVYAKHLEEEITAIDYVKVARQFIGTPYLWGGRSSFGIDCSGLVQITLQATDISQIKHIPRDSYDQSKALGRVLKEGEKPHYGDLVFWIGNAQGHVGIISGDNKILHANAYTMSVAEEDFASVASRIKKEIGVNPLFKRLDN